MICRLPRQIYRRVYRGFYDKKDGVVITAVTGKLPSSRGNPRGYPHLAGQKLVNSAFNGLEAAETRCQTSQKRFVYVYIDCDFWAFSGGTVGLGHNTNGFPVANTGL